MRNYIILVLLLFGFISTVVSQNGADFQEEKELANPKEFRFIGYYLMRYELVNYAPENEFFKGQVVGRLFGGNTTRTMDDNFAKIDFENYAPSEDTQTAMDKCPTGVIVCRGKNAPADRKAGEKSKAKTA